jgi:GalNAc-alpha-(1->4)-GalNAc-alpha-(1->3)-diNAcBac-PP-undecaprenol alpha-1,4-N-acetyl-D-galactosaminyltransferase
MMFPPEELRPLVRQRAVLKEVPCEFESAPGVWSRRNNSMLVDRPVRLTLVAAGLRCGGVERALVSLASGLHARGHRISVLTFAAAETDFLRLPQAIVRTSLGIRWGVPTPFLQLLPTTLARLKALRAAIDATEPDVVISHAAQINVPTLLALRGRAVPVIVTEHGDVPVRQDRAQPWLWKKWLWYRLRRLCYPSAFKVVSVSAAIDRNFAWLPDDRRSVIHNPFPPLDVQPMPVRLPRGLAPNRPWIASMGRLSYAKGFDVLLAAFARIAARFPEWQLVIIGDGELRERLHRQAGELIANDRIVFAGALAEPFALLQQAKFFVMASRYEGFPMAHGEALACGLPVIATDCPSRPLKRGECGSVAGGVRELVRENVDGVLVPCEDPAALANAMADLIENLDKRQRLARQAAPGIARFSCARIVNDWEELLEQARGPTGCRRPRSTRNEGS